MVNYVESITEYLHGYFKTEHQQSCFRIPVDLLCYTVAYVGADRCVDRYFDAMIPNNCALQPSLASHQKVGAYAML